MYNPINIKLNGLAHSLTYTNVQAFNVAALYLKHGLKLKFSFSIFQVEFDSHNFSLILKID